MQPRDLLAGGGTGDTMFSSPRWYSSCLAVRNVLSKVWPFVWCVPSYTLHAPTWLQCSSALLWPVAGGVDRLERGGVQEGELKGVCNGLRAEQGELLSPQVVG